MLETWRAVVGFPQYEVSDLGRVRRANAPRGPERSILKVCPHMATGYNRVMLFVKQKCHVRQVHRLVLEAFVGLRPAGMEGLHRDGNRTNNALYNLKWGTHQENFDDKIRHGKTKLDWDTVAKVRAMALEVVPGRGGRPKKKYKKSELAVALGITPKYLSRVLMGKHWVSEK